MCVCGGSVPDAKWSDPLKYLWACFLAEWVCVQRAVYHHTAEGVCTHLSCCKAPLSGTRFSLVSWPRKHTSLSLRLPPLGFRSGWHRAGGRKKTLSPSLPAPTKMNKNWKTTCKVHLIQEHLQYADVFFCTLCLLNCLWLRASVMKLYVLVERAASLFQLGPGPSLLSGFCTIFFF